MKVDTKTRQETIKWAKEIDKNYADLTTKYGAFKEGSFWRVNLWQPIAINVDIIIYDKNDQNKELKRIKGKFVKPNWTWLLKEDYDGYFYQYEITHKDGSITRALDPFAKSMAAFNWEGKQTNVGKAAFVNFKKVKTLRKLSKISESQPIIYEAHIRDLSSLRKDVRLPGSFNALKEIKIGEHLKDLGFTSIQFLPIHNCYTLNENDKTILDKGKGTGWNTNYNWGYDPHNYFSINGWYSTNPEDPYSRMKEFREAVKYMHSQDINVIVDVVYNHLMTNSILNNIFPDYYFRGGSDKENIVTPVSYPPLASDRLMCRRIIIESLEWFVEAYDVDGFRFDLSCFTDKITIEELTKRLRKIKPNIILHGEAWQWSDMNYDDVIIKGKSNNNLDFAYFNDTTRNAIRGEDDGDGFKPGLIGNNIDEEFGNYLPAIIGNIKEFPNEPKEMANSDYARFASNPNINLQYASCHDGHTLWDKVNLTTKGDKKYKFEILRQTILLQNTTQGRVLYLAGSEMLYSKPNDDSGQDGDRYHKSKDALDLFNLGNKYNENTYKTTDYSCGMRWEQLEGEVKDKIYYFLKKANEFRSSTPFFNLSTASEIQESIKFNYVNKEKGIIDFSVEVDNQSVRVIHNLKEEDYKYESNGEIIMDSKLDETKVGITKGHSSQIVKEKK